MSNVVTKRQTLGAMANAIALVSLTVEKLETSKGKSSLTPQERDTFIATAITNELAAQEVTDVTR